MAIRSRITTIGTVIPIAISAALEWPLEEVLDEVPDGVPDAPNICVPEAPVVAGFPVCDVGGGDCVCVGPDTTRFTRNASPKSDAGTTVPDAVVVLQLES